MAAFDGSDTVWQLTGDLCRALSAELGGVGCIVSRVIGDVLVQVAEHAPEGRTFQLGRGFLVSQFPLTSRVLATGNALAVSRDEVAVDAAELTVLEDLDVRSVLMLALKDEEAGWGLVELYRDSPAAFAQDEIERAQEIVRTADSRLHELLVARRLNSP